METPGISQKYPVAVYSISLSKSHILSNITLPKRKPSISGEPGLSADTCIESILSGVIIFVTNPLPTQISLSPPMAEKIPISSPNSKSNSFNFADSIFIHIGKYGFPVYTTSK